MSLASFKSCGHVVHAWKFHSDSRNSLNSKIPTPPHIGFPVQVARKMDHIEQLMPWTVSNSFIVRKSRSSANQSRSRESFPAMPYVDDVPSGVRTEDRDRDRVTQLFRMKDFEEALLSANDKLVVVEFAASHSVNSAKIYPAMVDLSRRTRDAEFFIAMGDISEDMNNLCTKYNITKVPHFLFFKGGELVHEEEGIDAEKLLGDVLYYGDNDAPIQQLRSLEDVDALLGEHASDQKLVIVDVSLKHCGPCVKVYPTVVKLAKRLNGTIVFARMFGDENEACKAFLSKLGVVEVPTFLFIRDGKLVGRYVGSGNGELIGEILKHQGVRVTY